MGIDYFVNAVKNVKSKLAVGATAGILTLTSIVGGCATTTQQNHVPDNYEPSIRTGMVIELPGGYKTKSSAYTKILHLAALHNGDIKPIVKGDGERIYVPGNFNRKKLPDEILIKACQFADINKNQWISGDEAKEAYRDEVERLTYSPK